MTTPKTCDLGIIGGGQLASMMSDAAHALGLRVAILGRSALEPALKKADVARVGDYHDATSLAALALAAQVLTFDLEDVDTQTLEPLEAQGKGIFPSPRLLRLIQDKGLQKDWLLERGYPVAPRVDLGQTWPVIVKARRGGYDGKGVWKVATPDQMPPLALDNTLIEQIAPIDKELSTVVARGQNGEIRIYPTVEMTFHASANLLDTLICPARIDLATQRRAQDLARSIAEDLGVVGILAIELFLLTSGELWVNELAPRPHNSGHVTLETAAASQFENHVRAVMGMALGDTTLKQSAVLFNVLGDAQGVGAPVYDGLDELTKDPDVHVHLYDKHETRPYRKMGHVTVTGALDTALAKAKTCQQTLRCRPHSN